MGPAHGARSGHRRAHLRSAWQSAPPPYHLRCEHAGVLRGRPLGRIRAPQGRAAVPAVCGDPRRRDTAAAPGTPQSRPACRSPVLERVRAPERMELPMHPPEPIARRHRSAGCRRRGSTLRAAAGRHAALDEPEDRGDDRGARRDRSRLRSQSGQGGLAGIAGDRLCRQGRCRAAGAQEPQARNRPISPGMPSGNSSTRARMWKPRGRSSSSQRM